MWVSVQMHASAVLLERKIPHYQSNRKMDALQNQSGSCKETKNLLPLPGIESTITMFIQRISETFGYLCRSS
jgi:hypothetical protein